MVFCLSGYKPAKTTKEMVDYLEENKRVSYSIMNKREAQEALLKYNYINVITPFKHVFARKEKDEEIRDEYGKHIYDRNIEFDEYLNLYKNERSKYKTIFANISEFESIFKSITSYYIVNSLENKIDNSNDLLDFIDRIKISISLLSLNDYKEERKLRMIEQIESLKNDVHKYHDIYCFFDRMSLGHLLTVYIGLNEKTQKIIFDNLTKYDMNLGATDVLQFSNKTFTLVGIRNCIAHNNSLEVLKRFYDPKNKIKRTSRDRQKYTSLINYLEKEKQSTIR